MNCSICGNYQKSGDMFAKDGDLSKPLCVGCFVSRYEKTWDYADALKAAGDALDDRIGCGCGASGPCMRCRKASENWEMAKGRKP